MKDEKKSEIEGYEFFGTSSSNNPELDGIDMYQEIGQTFECSCGREMVIEDELEYGCCYDCAHELGIL